MKRKKTAGYVVIVVILLILSFLCIYPMWLTFIRSFSDKVSIESGSVVFLPKGFNLQSYAKIIKDSKFFSSFFVSVKRVLVGCTVNMLIIILTAYPLCLPKKRFPASKYIKWFFIANMFFSGGLVPFYMLMRKYGLFDSFWALILPGAVPLGNIIFMINFFRNVPYSLNESAVIDGANPLQILFKIYVPLSVPSLACMLLFSFVGHWNAYFDGLIYINDTLKQPLQTYIYQMSVTIDFAHMDMQTIINLLKTSNKTLEAAKIFVAMIPILCVYPFVQKYFTTGMTLGAVKE